MLFHRCSLPFLVVLVFFSLIPKKRKNFRRDNLLRPGGLFNALKCEDFEAPGGIRPSFSPDRCAKYAADRKNIRELLFRKEENGHTMPDMVQGRRRWPGSSAASAQRAAARLIVAPFLLQLAGRRLVCGSARAAGILSAFSVGSLGYVRSIHCRTAPGSSCRVGPRIPSARRTVHRLRNAARSAASVRFPWRCDTW